jgi:hypothetical protein
MGGLRASARVRYEDLVSDPASVLGSLQTALSIDLNALIARIAREPVVFPTHGIAGNRMRSRGPQRLVLDAEWRTAVPVRVRRLAGIISPLLSRYGYRAS